MQRRQNDRMNFVAADVHFMEMMIPHHAQALIMSKLAPENDASPAVQRLAARIYGAQKDEIALMQTWLRDRAQAVPIIHFDGVYMHVGMEMPEGVDAHSVHGGHANHGSHSTHHDHHSGHSAEGVHEEHHQEHDHRSHEGHRDGHQGHTIEHTHSGHESSSADTGHSGHSGHDAQIDRHASDNHRFEALGHNHLHDHHDMPGMLTQEQLYELATAEGREFDRLFLTFMIEHHLGAVIMVNDLFATDGGALDREAYRLATDIYAEQITEIDLMRLMLRDY
ncbi:MAG: DUF305 domain-containing protein [Bacteroidetes bacterium]|nr:DUF305 domain-containing protein [Bacteroidota bacterium]